MNCLVKTALSQVPAFGGGSGNYFIVVPVSEDPNAPILLNKVLLFRDKNCPNGWMTFMEPVFTDGVKEHSFVSVVVSFPTGKLLYKFQEYLKQEFYCFNVYHSIYSNGRAVGVSTLVPNENEFSFESNFPIYDIPVSNEQFSNLVEKYSQETIIAPRYKLISLRVFGYPKYYDSTLVEGRRVYVYDFKGGNSRDYPLREEYGSVGS